MSTSMDFIVKRAFMVAGRTYRVGTVIAQDSLDPDLFTKMHAREHIGPYLAAPPPAPAAAPAAAAEIAALRAENADLADVTANLRRDLAAATARAEAAEAERDAALAAATAPPPKSDDDKGGAKGGRARNT